MRLTLALLAFAIVTITGCAPDPKSGDGFTLPEGDVERGQQTFARLQCNACHSVSGVDFEPVEVSEEKIIPLGGEKTYVTTYGDLVTSIINPSHRFAAGYKDEEIKTDGESKMKIYNDELTITQLSDIVTFLESHYQVRSYHPTPYMPYY